MLLLEGHSSAVYALAFSPDGRFLATGDKGGTAYLWDEGLDRQLLPPTGRPPAPDPVTVIEFHPGGGGVVVGTAAGWAGRWDAPEAGPRLFGPAKPDGVTGARFLSPTLLAVGYGNRLKESPGRLELWDLSTNAPRKPVFVAPHGVRAVAAHPPSGRVAWAEWGRRLSVWDPARAEPVRLNLPHDALAVGFRPDGSEVAAARDYGTAVFDLTKPAERLLNAGRLERLHLKGHKAKVSCLAYSPDGRTLATGSWDATVRLWDAATGAERATFEWPTGKVFALTYSPDGLRLAAAGEKGTVVLWDVE